jgi:CRISPR-associated protein Cas2
MRISEYRAVWLMVLYDLPVIKAEDRKQYAKFHKNLLKDGFVMMQYSIYLRHCASFENSETHISRVQNFLPPKGKVSMLTITEKQLDRMVTFWEGANEANPKPPGQLELF